MQTIDDALKALLQAPNLAPKGGCELLDEDDTVLEDLSDELGEGGQITRSNYADIHGRCTVRMSHQFDWTSQVKPRVRLYQTLTTGIHVEQVEVQDRPAVTVSQTENTADTWGAGAFTDTIVVAGALCLNHA